MTLSGEKGLNAFSVKFWAYLEYVAHANILEFLPLSNPKKKVKFGYCPTQSQLDINVGYELYKNGGSLLPFLLQTIAGWEQYSKYTLRFRFILHFCSHSNHLLVSASAR